MEIGVRLLAGANEPYAYLEIETTRVNDLRTRIEKTLAPLGVRVVHSESRIANGLRQERLMLEKKDGGPILPDMKLRLQVALLFGISEYRRHRSASGSQKSRDRG